MSAKDGKTFEKLRQFFRLNKGGTGLSRPEKDYVLTPEVIKELSDETPINQRLKTISALSDIVSSHRLEDNAAERLWTCLQDLLQEEVNREHRLLAFGFFRSLIQGQYDRLGSLMRVHFFNVIAHHNSEDVKQRLELFQSLTKNGQDIQYFEESVGPFLLNWMHIVVGANYAQEFLIILANCIKYNAAFIDDQVISGIVQNTCELCCNHDSDQVVLAGLQVLQIVISYSNLASESLPPFISALCRTVNLEAYCQLSWKVMRNLIGTHLGHVSMYIMCRILQDASTTVDVGLVRGAVFYITAALWGKNRVTTLKCTPTSVLPSLRAALKCDHTLVVFEVMLGVQSLISRFGSELYDSSWDLILLILDDIIVHIANQPLLPAVGQVDSYLQDTLNSIEQLMDSNQFKGNKHQVFEVIEKCASSRPESSILRLVNYLSNSIEPTQPNWLDILESLVDIYFNKEKRNPIRIKTLNVLLTIIIYNRSCYEEELVDNIVIPKLENVAQESEVIVRNSAAELLVKLCLECDAKRALKLMDIVEKILMRPFEQPNPPILSETEAADIKTVIFGLISVFTQNIYQLPSSVALASYRLLVSHLDMHYKHPSVLEKVTSIRFMIFECFLRLRADSTYHLGYPLNPQEEFRFSPYLLVDHHSTIGLPLAQEKAASPPTSPSTISSLSTLSNSNPPSKVTYPTCEVTYISLATACKAVVTCLKQELDWKVLLLVLQEVPQALKNKALVLARNGNDVDQLAAALCLMINDKTRGLPEALRNAPPKFTRTDFHSYIYPVLAALASYHSSLDFPLQQKLIKCLEVGLASRCARQCVMALTTCTLEMRDVMVKMLPGVLLNLSKMSATVYIAVPILEFLSMLTRLPKVFANFVGDQYMSVFAIALPYTNPFKYNHYTVSLAHHVIAVWFLKCRRTFRRDFVKFIITGLKANVLVPFEEGQMMKNVDITNEDSTNRKRSSSLTEQGSRRRERPISGASRLDSRGPVSDLKPPIDEALMTFHRELTETCIDLMARYTFSTCAAMPVRQPSAEFLLHGGQSMTWLLGNKLITVTTSGCSQKPIRNDLCDRCNHLCRLDKDAKPGSPLAADSDSKNRKAPNPGDTNSRSPVEEKKLYDFEPENKLDLFANQGSTEKERQVCICWCQNWAEVYIRRPTGDVSWMMRLQNEMTSHYLPDFPFTDITTLFFPTISKRLEEIYQPSQDEAKENLALKPLLNGLENHRSSVESLKDNSNPSSTTGSCERIVSEPVSIPFSPSRHSSIDSVHEEDDLEDFDSNSKNRNPVRRSNSSPEMSSNWKNPFLQKDCKQEQDKDGVIESKKLTKQMFNKDLRTNCEAIPEEMSSQGSTPPTANSSSLETPHHQVTLATLPETITGSHPSLISIDPEPWSSVSDNHTRASEFNTAAPFSREPKVNESSGVTSNGTDSVDGGGASTLMNILPSSHAQSQSALKFPAPTVAASQLSPRLQYKYGKESAAPSEADRRKDPATLPPLAFKRDRGHTISVMSPARKPKMEWESSAKAKHNSIPRPKEPTIKSGVNPSFVFLQLYHSALFGHSTEKPLLISQNHQRTINVLDYIPPYETHKIGVLYVGPGQANSEVEILRNQFGSVRYAEFLQRLGTLIKLADATNVFLGGLEMNGTDGQFAFVWQDDVMQVIFHTATLMPTLDTDPNCNNKKKNIGNDFVTIVYNESGCDYNIRTVKGQFNYACVIIEPLDHGSNQVTVKVREELVEHVGNSEPKIVSDQNVAVLARQLALHANLASRVLQSLQSNARNPYASNWLERLRKIKSIGTKVMQERSLENQNSNSTDTRYHRRVQMDDFTEYT